MKCPRCGEEDIGLTVASRDRSEWVCTTCHGVLFVVYDVTGSVIEEGFEDYGHSKDRGV